MLNLKTILLIFFLFPFTELFSQQTKVYLVPAKDSVRQKSHINVFIATLAIDGTIWAIDRYVLNFDFARISLKTMQKNLQTGFRWDNDRFQTNMFDHTAHGGFNFNSANFNGLNYWESVPYSLLSSLIWELFLENEPPSINDLFSSTIGGLAIGEVTGRIAQVIHAPYQTGIKRFGSELISFVLTPTVTLQRAITGELCKTKSLNQVKPIPVGFQIGAGIDLLDAGRINGNSSLKSTFLINVNYNDLFDLKTIKPFDHFTLRSKINVLGGQPLINKLNIQAVIYGKKIELENKGRLFAGIFQHYHYYDSDTLSSSNPVVPYKLAVPASYGLGIIYDRSEGKIRFSGSAHISGIITGAAITDHYNVKNRNYNLGAGYSGKIHTAANYNDKVSAKIDLQYFHFFTWKGMPPGTEITDENLFSFQGDKGNSIFLKLLPSVEINISRRLSLGLEMMYGLRKNHYFYFDDVQKTMIELSGNLMYNF